MATITYTWNIDSVDAATASMVVSYTHSGMTIPSNLPSAPAGTSVEEHIAKFAPLETWKRILTPRGGVEPGTSGSVNVEVPVPVEPSKPQA